MGSSKAWLDFCGETLLLRVVRRVAEVADGVVVVASRGQVLPVLPAGTLLAFDPVAGRGPLVGLAAGLDAIAERTDAAFVSSTDAPFLHPAFIRRLVALRRDHDIVVPQVGGRIHPLAPVYSTRVLGTIAALLAEHRQAVRLLFERMRTLVASEAMLLADPQLAMADPGLRSLCNVNTPDEYAAARAVDRGLACVTNYR